MQPYISDKEFELLIEEASRQWRARPQEEKRVILQQAGILDENNQLAKRYCGLDSTYEPKQLSLFEDL